jgi:hypothetical protein
VKNLRGRPHPENLVQSELSTGTVSPYGDRNKVKEDAGDAGDAFRASQSRGIRLGSLCNGGMTTPTLLFSTIRGASAVGSSRSLAC